MTTLRLLRIVLLIGFLLSISFVQSQSSFAVPPAACTEVIFYKEDHEGGANGWTSPSNYNPPGSNLVAWSLNAGDTQHWFANNYGVITEALLISPTITIPATATDDIFLRFYHRFDTEPSVDGGIVEVSINGSSFNDVGADRFTDNPYTEMLSGGTVLGIRKAFTRRSEGYPGYLPSIVNLSGLASGGDEVQIRYRFATSPEESGVGWYVDDVELGYCGATNAPPIASDASLSTREDTQLTGSVTASDPDGDLLTFSLGAAPAHGSALVQADGSFTYTPASNYNGIDSFTVLVDDGNGGTDTATVTINVDPVNDAPSFTLSGNPPAVDEDAGVQTIPGFAANISPGPNDEAGQVLAFNVSITTTTGNLTFTSAPAVAAVSGNLTYAADANAYGTATVQLTLSDSGGSANSGSDTSLSQSFTIAVNPVNDPPVANDLNSSTPEDTPLNGSATASDIEGDTLAFALHAAPANGLASVSSDGSFTYTPNADYAGSDTFVFSVSDGNGGSDTGMVTVTVGSTNDNPVVTAGADIAADPNTEVTVSAVYTDVDAGDSHSAMIDWGDGGAPEIVTANSGVVSGVHTYTGSGNFTVMFTVSDNHGGSGSDTLIVSVNAPTLTPSPTPTPTYTETQTIEATPSPTATASLTPVPSLTPAITATFIPTSTVAAPPPPPAPLAADVNAASDGIVRSGVPDQLRNDINVREIVVNGEYPTWQGSASAHAGFIGNPGILEMGVRQAVDIFSPTGLSYFEGGIVICLRGEGTLIYMNANHAPRFAEIVGSYEVPEFPGFTCVTLFEPGTLVLVDPIE